MGDTAFALGQFQVVLVVSSTKAGPASDIIKGAVITSAGSTCVCCNGAPCLSQLTVHLQDSDEARYFWMLVRQHPLSRRLWSLGKST